VEEAEKLHKWAKRSELFLLEDSNHVFGTKYPWEKADLSEDLASVSQKTIEFLKSNQR
jgi:dTDP-4-amino-4,6-dideoxygalactose transaminase